MTFLSEPGVYLTRLSCAIVVLLLDIVGSRLYERFLPAAPSLAPARRVFFVAILAIQTLLYTVDATVFVVVSVSNYELPATLPSFSECFLFFAVLLQFSSFFEQEETPHWGLHVLGWLLLFAAECLICVFRAVTSRGLCVFQFTCGLGLALAVVKGLLWLALGSLFLLQWLRDGYEKCPTDDEAATESATNPPNEDDDDDQGEPGIDVVGIRRPAAKELKEAGGWWNFVKRYQMFLGFIWPKGRGMQRRFIACVFGVMIESYLAYLVPLQFATFMDSLGAGVSSYIWTAFMWLRILHLATSDAGLVFPRNLMWMSVSQHRHLGLNTAAHDKMMNLDAFLQSVISSAIKIQAVDSAKPITSIIDDVFFEMLPHAVKLVCASVTVHHRFGPQMTLIMLCTTFLLALSQLRVLPILAKRYDETLAKFYKANQRRHDDIKGWPTVDNHDRVKEETELYKNEREEHRDQYLTYTTAFYYLRGGNGLVVQIFETLAQALVIYQIQKGIATGGDMVAFAGLWPFIYEPLRFFTSFFNDKVETIFGATPLRRIWEVEKEIGDGTEVLACPKGKIEVRDMEFSFPKSSCKIFNGFNIIIPAGAKVGIFGGSGCGKSTLAALLMRRFQIQSGSILVDDQDISKVTSASLHQKVTSMDQQPSLFNRSIMENVRFARKDATDEEVKQACMKAQIHHIIEARPKKYDTIIQENGANISGGERQRLCLARLFLTIFTIALADEITSALDLRTEAEVLKNIKKEFAEQTMIFITHRLATIRNLDFIVVLGPGGVVLETGTHEKLMEQEGEYYDLCRLNEGLDARPSSDSKTGTTVVGSDTLSVYRVS